MLKNILQFSFFPFISEFFFQFVKCLSYIGKDFIDAASFLYSFILIGEFYLFTQFPGENWRVMINQNY